MREVQVLQATKTALNSRGRNNNYAVQIDRIRVHQNFVQPWTMILQRKRSLVIKT